MAGAIKAVIAAQFDPTGLNKANAQFKKLGNTVRGALGTIGVTASLAGLVSGLNNASKAAVSDVKSQALLAAQLRNTTNANDAQIASVESAISAMELQAAVADDKIRPAFAQLVRATKDVGVATKLTQLALDVSAGTGRDLGAVSIALSRAYQGNTTALSRLGIKAKEGVNIFDQLQTEFGGAAQTAANNDPYQQLETIFGRLQEQVGMALLPSLQNLSSWLGDPGTQGAIQYLIEKFNEFVTSLQNVVDGANYVGQALANVLNIDAGLATRAWDGFFRGLQESALRVLLGPAYPLFKLLGIVGGATSKAKPSFTPTTFTPVAFTPVDTRSTGSKQKTKAQTAAEKAAKAYEKAVADLKKFQTDIKGMADFTSLTKMSEELGQFEQSVTDSFDEIYKKLADAPKGTNLTKLKAFLDAEKALLVKNAKDRDAIVKKRQDVEALITDIKSSISGMGKLANLLDTSTRTITKTITKIVNGFKVATTTTMEEALGAKGYQKRLEDILSATKNFATQLTQLKAAGLTADLFLEIAQAGPEVGGQLAAEILAGGADAISALNTTYGDLQAVSSAIAEQTAAVLYNNGVEVAGGLVKGLLADEQKLVDAGKTLADQFNTGYSEQLAGLTVPKAPVVTPKTQTKVINNTAKIQIKATPNTKADAQKTVSALNKFYATNTGAKVAAGKFVF